MYPHAGAIMGCMVGWEEGLERVRGCRWQMKEAGGG